MASSVIPFVHAMWHKGKDLQANSSQAYVISNRTGFFVVARDTRTNIFGTIAFGTPRIQSDNGTETGKVSISYDTETETATFTNSSNHAMAVSFYY